MSAINYCCSDNSAINSHYRFDSLAEATDRYKLLDDLVTMFGEKKAKTICSLLADEKLEDIAETLFNLDFEKKVSTNKDGIRVSWVSIRYSSDKTLPITVSKVLACMHLIANIDSNWYMTYTNTCSELEDYEHNGGAIGIYRHTPIVFTPDDICQATMNQLRSKAHAPQDEQGDN